MTGFQLLLLVELIATLGLSLAATATRDVRWLAAGFFTFALYLLCQFANAM